MASLGKIITVGLSPAWDVTCRVDCLDWGKHTVVSSYTQQPAGKALNISQALEWMGTRNTAAGLWGCGDYQQMLKVVRPLRKLVEIKLTAVDGRTRQNITIIDSGNKREMHLRNTSELASKKSLGKLKRDLEPIVKRNSVCVFSGSLPSGKLMGDVVGIIESCRKRGAKIVLDSSGPAFKKIVNTRNIWLIKPNVEELSELLGRNVNNRLDSLIKAARALLDRVEIVLISRGKRGAVLVTKEGAWQGCYVGTGRKVLSTVACGDYLLAGFLKGLKQTGELGFALETGIKAATAKAWGWTNKKSWQHAQRQTKVWIRP